MLENNWTLQPQDIFKRSPIVPVMVINKIEHAVPLAKALVAGGISVLEVTLRTECALEAIALIAKEVPEALVGAGTILNELQLQQAVDAGSQFIITPGATVDLLKAAKRGNVPLIPGVASISEVMAGMELGYTHFKFFPAEASGGVNALKAFSGPLANIRFCPTGGITPTSYKNYLALANVDCIGGSWIAPTDAMEQEDWGRITQLCKDAIGAL
ncbi:MULTISPECIES: bifunctional 4-hydroxy-2-oxoglutarate aldolase/2-dehydro-3-deoxy-phosphogluconate aldolase [unclassified Shewanella]|uniref:bifunctional 4-hydroxy-2-oxoglutarate aldolase/2-dehydro-3-deoxy-phosphogluconate aldolase n=1 Tax=unclassified Shewanella TaxID=196818 RepID=UPI000C83088B|nr:MULTISPECIES: bifunctional 4-hydroxy-2-oxoglutarate aldolase/2-dehydro-3-deoxy-phosphogluconate aldolase [unclassified Shewanella]MDO6680457.1 bifunctional 4-hydroxy-2-oxoglutarate aldolase/2-dehydro-3-deoxy-phosphogluconate aldolase [Shewanella sp. 4_MG-2023]MDO6776444.1 bifunctional 4-hydroxy-2-oxoglutarate aldolase/2-dehydro-3-deoxy-phosphogluconate aldolase [Shewanella sp. 3_MG-2023]PMH89383.1 keto-deoxy-phosphogluconate aldolase [Shewanella sp. 10N.286.48.B5]